MSYSVVRKPRTVQVAAQPAATRGTRGDGSHDRGGATGRGRGGLGTAPATGTGGLGTGSRGRGRGGLGTGTGTGTGTGGGGLGTGTGKGKGSSTVLQRCPAAHQKATLQKSAPKTTHSYGAYSVTVPDQKKRSDLQKKAAAELAALEKLKRRNIVSITPSAVGGTLTQEEVRRKQQQDFSKAETLQTELSGPTPAKPKE